MMPGADGFAVLRWVTSRPRGSRVPVLAVTGASDADREEALRLGAAACVAKPFDLDDLAAAVRRVLTAPADHPAA